MELIISILGIVLCLRDRNRFRFFLIAFVFMFIRMTYLLIVTSVSLQVSRSQIHKLSKTAGFTAHFVLPNSLFKVIDNQSILWHNILKVYPNIRRSHGQYYQEEDQKSELLLLR
jgi:disulfide bond formation protein DsbB